MDTSGVRIKAVKNLHDTNTARIFTDADTGECLFHVKKDARTIEVRSLHGFSLRLCSLMYLPVSLCALHQIYRFIDKAPAIRHVITTTVGKFKVLALSSECVVIDGAFGCVTCDLFNAHKRCVVQLWSQYVTAVGHYVYGLRTQRHEVTLLCHNVESDQDAGCLVISKEPDFGKSLICTPEYVIVSTGLRGVVFVDRGTMTPLIALRTSGLFLLSLDLGL